MLFFGPPDPSVSIRIFFGWRIRMSIIRTAENPKFGKFRVKIRASIFKNLGFHIFYKNVEKS